MLMPLIRKSPIPFVLSIVSLSCTFLCILGMVYLLKKYKDVMLLVTASHMPKVSTMGLPSFHYTKPTPAPSTTGLPPIDLSSVDWPTISVIFALEIMFVSYKLIKHIFRNKNHNMLMIELTNGKHSVNVAVANLPVCVELCYLSGSQVINNINLHKHCLPVLSLDYGD